MVSPDDQAQNRFNLVFAEKDFCQREKTHLIEDIKYYKVVQYVTYDYFGNPDSQVADTVCLSVFVCIKQLRSSDDSCAEVDKESNFERLETFRCMCRL